MSCTSSRSASWWNALVPGHDGVQPAERHVLLRKRTVAHEAHRADRGGFDGAYVCDWGAESRRQPARGPRSRHPGRAARLPRRRGRRRARGHAARFRARPRRAGRARLHARHEAALDAAEALPPAGAASPSASRWRGAWLRKRRCCWTTTASCRSPPRRALRRHRRIREDAPLPGRAPRRSTPWRSTAPFATRSCGPRAPCSYASGYDAQTGAASEAQLDEAARLAAQADVAVGVRGAARRRGVGGCRPRRHGAAGRPRPAGRAHVRREPERRRGAAGRRSRGAAVARTFARHPAELSGGCQGGKATANLLQGRANPSGKLADPARAPRRHAVRRASIPSAAGRRRTARASSTATASTMRRASSAYPFGHGRSYTTFAYRDLDVEPHGNGCSVSFTLRDEGARAGKEAVQVYVTPRAMAAFHAPLGQGGARGGGGAPREGSICPAGAFAHYDTVAAAWQVEGGAYDVRVAASSRDVRLSAAVEVAGEPSRATRPRPIARRGRAGSPSRRSARCTAGASRR